jgi:hypothetical protein
MSLFCLSVFCDIVTPALSVAFSVDVAFVLLLVTVLFFRKCVMLLYLPCVLCCAPAV